jgi:hypothetical protein
MTIYNVHIYREMRLVFGGIEAGSHEAAAASAREKPADQADSIDDCEGETTAALVDVQGDEEYEHSRTIDFEVALQRKAAPKLLDSLKVSEGFVQWALDRGADKSATAAALTLIRTAIAEAEIADIRSEPPAAIFLSALKAVLPYAENECASLRECRKRDGDPRVEDELDACDRALAQAHVAIVHAEATGLTSPRPATEREIQHDKASPLQV